MLRYRSFRNMDSPAIADVWRSRAPRQGLLQPISVGLLEQFVFGKIHFDPKGLILAFDDDLPVGFAHAGFGPDRAMNWIDTALGVICLVVVRPDCPENEVARELLARSEEYLVGRGATVLQGGGLLPVCPFYLGLYGGSEPPGVLDSDLVARTAFESAGYEPSARTAVFQRDVANFGPAVDRRLRKLQRRTTIHTEVGLKSRNRWEARTAGDFDLTRFELLPHDGRQPIAHATVRSMESISPRYSGRVVGLIEIHVDPEHRRQGIGAFLLSEVFRSLAREGVVAVQTQTLVDNQAGIGLLKKLGLIQIDHGVIFRKIPSSPERG